MDVLTSAADAILKESKENSLIPVKKSRPTLGNLTNKPIVNCSPNQISDFSLNALFKEKITCTTFAKLKTPGKRRKSSQKFGDENQAPLPKTPKNDAKNLKSAESPCTPLSNLKMLTRIASREEYIPSKKSLFETTAAAEVHAPKIPLRRCISENTSLLGNKNEVTKPKLKRHPTSSDLDVNTFKNNGKCLVPSSELSRREKSLGLLCERFLEYFPIEVSCLETPRRLVIDDVASILGTERRRVYDIVNILECLNMASRVQKNMYQWMGKQHLETTLSKLKGLAEEWGIGVHLSSPIEQSLRELKHNGNTQGSHQTDKADARKEKSIGILCQKFLMLFLTSPSPHKIQLERAIHLLLGQEGDDLEKLRTRGRRIYDIANVLVALRLIKKLPQCKSFMYTGPQVEATKSVEGTSAQLQTKLRHSLLPPPLTLSVYQKNTYIARDEAVITPSDVSDDPILKKGRPRKLATEFMASRARRNCLIGRTKSEESLSDAHSRASSDIIKYPSLQEVCQVAEIERKKLLNVSRIVDDKPKPLQFQTSFTQVTNKTTKALLFSHTGSPRMALTFQNPTSQSPPSLTGSPASPSTNVSRVVVRPPFILHKMNVSKSLTSQDGKNCQKPLLVIKTGLDTTDNSTKVDSNSGAKGFRVYTRKNKDSRTMSVPSIFKSGEPKPVVPSKGSLKSFDHGTPVKGLTKSLSQTALPNISLNTLSRNHYKTVIGSSARPTSCSFSAPREGSYRFVINTKDIERSSKASSDSSEFKKELPMRQPAFVNMFQAAPLPDDSNTDSELESIFGDSFKFTRPKKLLHKI